MSKMSVIATPNVHKIVDKVHEGFSENDARREIVKSAMKGACEPVDLSLKFRDAAVQTEETPGDAEWRENLANAVSRLIYNKLVDGQNMEALKNFDVSVPKIQSILKQLEKVKENPSLCLFGPTTKSIKMEESSGKLWMGGGLKCTVGRDSHTNPQGPPVTENYGVKKEEPPSSHSVLTPSDGVVTRQNVPVIDVIGGTFKNPLGELEEGVKNLPNNDNACSAFSQYPSSRWRPYDVHQNDKSHGESLSSYFNPLYFKGLPFQQSSILPFQNRSLSVCQTNIPPLENMISLSGEEDASSLPTKRMWPSDLPSSETNSEAKSHLMERMSSPLEILRRSAEREMAGRMGKMKRRHSLFEIERRKSEAGIKKTMNQDETRRNSREHHIKRLEQAGILERTRLNEEEYKTKACPLDSQGRKLEENENPKRSRKDERIMRLPQKEVLSFPEESMVRWQGNNNKDVMRIRKEDEMLKTPRADEMSPISRGDDVMTGMGADERSKWTLIPRENEMARRLSVDSMISGKGGKSEKLVQDFLIPLSLTEIIESSMDDFNDFLCNRNLTEDQVSVCRDLRRRGKNKIAAQNCRKRKVEQVKLLETEVETMRRRRGDLLKERVALQGERGLWENKISRLEKKILTKMEKQPGQWKIKVEEGRMDFVKCEEEEEKKGVEKSNQVKHEKLTRKL